VNAAVAYIYIYCACTSFFFLLCVYICKSLLLTYLLIVFGTKNGGLIYTISIKNGINSIII